MICIDSRWNMKNKFSIFFSLLLIPKLLVSTNGLFMISYGSKFSGIAGAGSSTKESVFSNFLNPANLSFYLEEPFHQWELSIRNNLVQSIYDDQYINPFHSKIYSNHNNTNLQAILPNVGYGLPLNNKIFYSISFLVKGGGGGNIENILFYNKNFEALKENYLMRMANPSIIQGIGFNINQINCGLGYELSYLFINMQNHKKDLMNLLIEPEQSFEFSGKDVSHAIILGISQKIIFNKLNFIWGASYHSPNIFRIKGKIKSYETYINHQILEHKAEGRIIFPEYYRSGIQLKFNLFRIYIDLNYILWKSYFRKIQIKADSPFITTPIGFTSNTIQIKQNWRNQIVYALGMEFYHTSYIFSIGYNYGRIPTPSDGIHPLLTMPVEHHLTLGVAKNLNLYTIFFSYEHGFKNKSEFDLSKTNFISDWFLFHTNAKPTFFKYNRTMELKSFTFGLERKI